MSAAVPTHWQRVYRDRLGLEYTAEPGDIGRVLRSMNECKDSEFPFRVRIRMSDGSQVMASPKNGRG